MIINILLVISLYALVFTGSEILYRKFHAPFLLSRKLAHIFGSAVSFFLPYLMPNLTAVVIGLLFALIIFVSKKNNILKSIHNNRELGIGEIVFPIGIAMSALLIWPMSVAAYQGSCVIFGLSDGLAGYIGNIYGKRKYQAIGGSKTIEGSAIFFLVTIIVLFVYHLSQAGSLSAFGIVMLFVCAAGVTIVESVFSCGWDNLVVPIASGLALLLILS